MPVRPLNIGRIIKLTEDPDRLTEFLFDHSLLLDFQDIQCFQCFKGTFKKYKKKHQVDSFIWKCTNKRCSKSFSSRTGSWFEGAKISLKQVLILTHCWALGYPNWTAAIESDVSEHSVVQWYNFCREVCIFACDLNQDQQPNKKIGGVGKVVELDESHFGKQNIIEDGSIIVCGCLEVWRGE